MKIITLIEDTSGSNPACAAEHGLSFYIETKQHHLLMDTGSSELTWNNAAALGVDLALVDTVVLSHGHYDHTGGVMSFLRYNDHANIYLHKKAGLRYSALHAVGEEYIGIDPAILKLPNLHLIDANVAIDEELFLFTGVTGRKLWPRGNRTLHLQKEDGSLIQDVFDHEQYLVISQEAKNYLISGCAHNGILNILEKYRELSGSEPDVVISGFHMINREGYSSQDVAEIRETGEILSGMKTKFYTGHCTGEAFRILKEIMGDQLVRIHAGEKLIDE